MTLSIELHRAFDELKLWLIPVEEVSTQITGPQPAVIVFPLAQGEKDAYIIHGVPSTVAAGFPIEERIDFQSTHEALKLPDPRFIALHAACAQVAHEAKIFKHTRRKPFLPRGRKV
jgi:hypothetical protein